MQNTSTLSKKKIEIFCILLIDVVYSTSILIKRQVLPAILLSTAILLAISTTKVHADTTANGTANVILSAGTGPQITSNTDGSLNAPSFGFGTVNIGGQPHSLAAIDYKNRIDTNDTYTGSNLQVSDFSGSKNGWKLSVELGAMYVDNDKSNSQLTGTVLELNSNGVIAE